MTRPAHDDAFHGPWLMTETDELVLWRSAPDPHWVSAREPQLAIDDLGFRQGVVAVERLRSYDGRPVLLDRHLARWRRTLDYLQLRIDSDRRRLAERLGELIQRNHAWCRRVGEFGITLLATPGSGRADEPQPIELMHLNPLPLARIEQHRRVGQPLVISDVQQPPAGCWPRDIKVRCRLHYYTADRAARLSHPDAIGLLVDADGSVTETSIANLAIVRGNQILSPAAEQVLPGVTISVVEQAAAALGLPWQRQPLFPADVRSADEVWLMGTDGGLWFASTVDAVAVGQHRPGPVYQTVLPEFLRRVAEAAEPSTP